MDVVIQHLTNKSASRALSLLVFTLLAAGTYAQQSYRSQQQLLGPGAEEFRPAGKETFRKSRNADAVQRLEASGQVPLGVSGSLLASQGKSGACGTAEKCSTRNQGRNDDGLYPQ
jgi:hypothetical protein